MLQFITDNKSKYSAAEQAQMATEGGCRWIQLNIDEADPDQIRTDLDEITPVCKETDSFLVIEHDVDLTDELKIHGVHLKIGDKLPREAREALGPHAVVGVTVSTAEEIIALRWADIDYVQIGPYPVVSTDTYGAIVAKVADAGVKIPIVAFGDITIEDLRPLMATGISGVAFSKSILDAEDPVDYTRRCIATLYNS